MPPLRPTLLLLALLGACGRRQSESPAVAAAPRPVIAADIPAIVDSVAPGPADPPPPVAPAAPVAPVAPSPEEVLLRGLADGSEDLAAHIDPAHGVVFVTYVEAMPDGRTPTRRSTRRLCGAAAGRDVALRARLRDAVARTVDNPDGLLCRDDECLTPGMEYQPSYHLLFGRSPDGTRVLLAALEQSEAAMGEPWLTAMRTFVDRALAAARARPCPR